MANWWEIEDVGSALAPAEIKAIAYYRHSAQDRQENSIPIQQEQVREWARNHGVEIIQEFADYGRSGLTSEGRPAFTDMMENWVKKRRVLMILGSWLGKDRFRYQPSENLFRTRSTLLSTFSTPPTSRP